MLRAIKLPNKTEKEKPILEPLILFYRITSEISLLRSIASLVVTQPGIFVFKSYVSILERLYLRVVLSPGIYSSTHTQIRSYLSQLDEPLISAEEVLQVLPYPVNHANLVSITTRSRDDISMANVVAAQDIVTAVEYSSDTWFNLFLNVSFKSLNII